MKVIIACWDNIFKNLDLNKCLRETWHSTHNNFQWQFYCSSETAAWIWMQVDGYWKGNLARDEQACVVWTEISPWWLWGDRKWGGQDCLGFKPFLRKLFRRNISLSVLCHCFKYKFAEKLLIQDAFFQKPFNFAVCSSLEQILFLNDLPFYLPH